MNVIDATLKSGFACWDEHGYYEFLVDFVLKDWKTKSGVDCCWMVLE